MWKRAIFIPQMAAAVAAAPRWGIRHKVRPPRVRVCCMSPDKNPSLRHCSVTRYCTNEKWTKPAIEFIAAKLHTQRDENGERHVEESRATSNCRTRRLPLILAAVAAAWRRDSKVITCTAGVQNTESRFMQNGLWPLTRKKSLASEWVSERCAPRF